MDATRYIGRKKQRRYRRFWSKVTTERYKELLGYARYLTNGDESRALDLVQLVILRIFQYLPNPAKIKRTKFFLIASLRNCWIRSRKRNEEVSLDQAYEEMIEIPSLTISSSIQKKIELTQIVDTERENMKAIFPDFDRLYEMKLMGFSFREINEALGRDGRFAEAIWQRFVNNVRKQITPPRKSKSSKKPAA